MKTEKKEKAAKSAMAFIVLMGIVSLFSDMTHEGARSVLGDFLSLEGASAAQIGFISGFGELCGYGLRLLSGRLADKTKRYWLITILGYGLQLAAIPLLALVPNGGWIIAGGLIIMERVGKALKKPAKNTLVSFAASEVGQGKGFAWQEFLDQLGAFAGPVILFIVCSVMGTGNAATSSSGTSVKLVNATLHTYSVCFAVLGIPALICMALLIFSKIKYPNPEEFEKDKGDNAPFSWKKSFIFYMLAICMFALGFADFTLITMHAARTALIPERFLSLLYAAAMAIDAFAALFFGWLYDKKGIRALIISTIITAPFSVLVFLINQRWALFIGVLLWGIGMGAQESIMKAAVSGIVSKQNRSSAFGIFETGFGVAWFLGSWLLGVLYDHTAVGLAAFSVTIILLAVPFYVMCMRTSAKPQAEAK